MAVGTWWVTLNLPDLFYFYLSKAKTVSTKRHAFGKSDPVWDTVYIDFLLEIMVLSEWTNLSFKNSIELIS